MQFICLVVLIFALFASPLLRAAQPIEAGPAPTLDHLAVWAKDLDKTATFLSEALGWKRHPLEFGIGGDSKVFKVFGGMKLAFLDANGTWLELVEPTTPGPGMDLLRAKGKGSLVELNFSIGHTDGDFERQVASLKSHGIEPIGMDGKPLQNDGRSSLWVIKDGTRRFGEERLVYIPLDVSGGTAIELYWEYPSGVVLLRDATWKEGERTPRSGPRVDHVVVLAQDLEKTAKFYTDVLGLRRNPRSSGFPRRWMGSGADRHAWIDGGDGTWIELVSPAPGSAGAKLLENPRFGDGAILELDVEVPDADTFYDRMRAKGLTMTAGDSTALAVGEKAVVLPTGDRFSYFPQTASQGMRIMVFQRGPAASSLLPEPRELRRSGGTQGS